MSLVKHRPKLSLQLPQPRTKINGCSSFLHLPKPISNPSIEEVGNLFDLEKLCVLGHGNSGIVYKVRHKHTSAIYALKVIRGEESNPSLSYQPSNEMKILRSTNSPFIIKCHGIFDRLVGEKAILMEYMDAGTLDTLLKINGPFSESSIAHIAYQVLNGLNYLHACNIVHLDIKPSNLLVDKNMNVKIADFGVSQILHMHGTPSNCCDSYVGTFAYMSPERLDSSRYDAKYVYAGDIWSLGVTLLELYMGHFPFFPPGNKPSWMELLMVTCFGEIPNLPKQASEEFKSFIKCCLEKEPSTRCTVSQLLSHPFVCIGR